MSFPRSRRSQPVGLGAIAFAIAAIPCAWLGCDDLLGFNVSYSPPEGGAPVDATAGSDGCAAASCNGACGQLAACGRIVDCGACPLGQNCGGGGTPNTCGVGTCTPSCAGKVCGDSDQCGGVCGGAACGSDAGTSDADSGDGSVAPTVVPSNVADVGKLRATGLTLSVPLGTSFDTDACQASSVLGACATVTPAKRSAICVCRADQLSIHGLSVMGSAALTLLVDSSITIDGPVVVSAGTGWTKVPTGAGGAGGSYGTSGGASGEGWVWGMVGGEEAATPVDPTFGAVSLIPLQGGMAGQASVVDGGAGGGAVQMTAGQSITVTAGGSVSTPGAGGAGTCSDGSGQQAGGGGGGSGGGILLEALKVSIAGSLAANGGGGGGGGFACTNMAMGCGGQGATGDLNGGAAAGQGNVGTGSAGNGSGASGSNGSATGACDTSPGGGGGGGGRIRVNTTTGSCDCTGLVAPSASRGVVATSQ